ncbi:MAG: hypothetical protein M0R21_12820 [Lentimicrobiaceae bacterium]|jgi:hypothetical protein|nr:hypothetical protein [Lentimicrobiaceae bacterium]
MKPNIAAILQIENHPAGIRQINIVLPLPGIISYSETVTNLYFIYFSIAFEITFYYTQWVLDTLHTIMDKNKNVQQ